jgi:hypothetical protein
LLSDRIAAPWIKNSLEEKSSTGLYHLHHYIIELRGNVAGIPPAFSDSTPDNPVGFAENGDFGEILRVCADCDEKVSRLGPDEIVGDLRGNLAADTGKPTASVRNDGVKRRFTRRCAPKKRRPPKKQRPRVRASYRTGDPRESCESG